MNMEKININSMDYRKLSKEDKLKVVRFKINKLLSDTSSSKAYEYYNGKNNRIKYIKKYLYEMTNLYKKNEYKNAKIIKIQGYDSNSAYIPYSKLGDYKTLYKYLKLLEMKKRELESIEVKLTEISNDKKEDSYEYLTEDDNPYETGYMQFTTSYTAKKDTPVVESTSVKSNDITSVKSNDITSVKSNDTTSVKSNNECKELMVIDNKDNKKEKTGFGKKILGFLAGTAIIGGICKGAKWVGNKFKNGFNKVKNETKEVSEILRKNKVKTAICAWIVAAAAVVCSFLPKSQSKKHKPDDIVKPTSVVETTEPSTKKDDIIIDEPVIEEPTEVVTENKEYNLGESVNIKDNSYIYTNSYDATDSTNKCTPYYNGSYDREVMGVTYELDGNLYTIYRDDMNASEKVNELISKGAKQTAVLVVRSDLVNTGDYEGYYNIDSIKRVRTR